MRTPLRTLTAALAAAVALTACGGAGQTGSAAGDPDAPLRVGVSPVPHAEILGFVADELAADAGLDVEIVEFTDYVQPNVALAEGELDANYFQTVPYLEEQVATAGYEFVALEPVHLEPLGIYSDRHASLDELPAGATVAIANDPANAARGLRLLEANGLIDLADTGEAAPTVLDIQDNPRELDITEIEAAQLPRTLQDVDAAVVNGNYAIEAGLVPADDALALEAAEGNPNANLVVVRDGDQADPRVEELERLLHSEEVRDFIDQTYEGAVLPAF
ncbi:MetQ/NlpA family ABC transporter substrate-binding protein [Egicoccus sp. AB-alg2]|uniref:MetQ/NlpA family ABC transporter substrate-binding protein n=1 Tax=Egicoccus sp. AB-alg2 TaxID=3242693 RepID=UPI00359DC6F1